MEKFVPRTYNDIVRDFEKYKNEIFKGVWLIRYSSFAVYTNEQIKTFDKRIRPEPVKCWKTIDFMVELIKKRESFDFIEGKHIQPIYEIVMGYLKCIHELSQNTYSLNASVRFPIDDIVALDELAAICFNQISYLYGDKIAKDLEDKKSFAGFANFSKQSSSMDNNQFRQYIEDRKTISRPDYIDAIFIKAGHQ